MSEVEVVDVEIVDGSMWDFCEQVTTIGTTREEWLRVRRTGLGASDMSKIAMVNRFGGSLYDLWLDKTGRAPVTPPSRRMRMGNILEPVVRDIYEEETGHGVAPYGMLRSLTHPIFLYTPDGIVPAINRLFEAKTTNWRQADDWANGQTPDHAEVQVQAGMFVTGLHDADVAVMFDGDPDTFTTRHVTRDNDLIGALVEMGERFWADYVAKDVAPPITWRDLDAVKGQHPNVQIKVATANAADADALLEQYQLARAQVKAGEQAKAEAEALLIDLIGDAEELHAGGDTRFTYKQQTRTSLDAKALAEAHPDIDLSDYQKTTTFRRLNVPANK